MSGRRFLAAKAKYGFNGKEKDNEDYGEGNAYDYGMRFYDPRLGRFLSVDPIANNYPELSPYQFSTNSPIQNIDIDGLEGGWAGYGQGVPNNAWNDVHQGIRTGYKKGTIGILSATDVNDATVITTWMTRGSSGAINIDKSKANAVDKTFAIVGAAIPFVSGSLVKTVLKGVGNAGIKGAEVFVKEFKNIDKISSKPWYKYQEQITGLAGNIEIKVGGVLFDGFKNGKLVEAKGIGYSSLLKNEKFGDKVMDKLIDQATRQVDAAKGVGIEWNFAEKGAADLFSKELKERGIKGIEVKHTEMKFEK